MEITTVLLLVIGWLSISCGVARVLGGACDIGKTPAEGWSDINIASFPLSLADDDYCLGLILERTAKPPATHFPVLIQRRSCACAYVAAPPG